MEYVDESFAQDLAETRERLKVVADRPLDRLEISEAEANRADARLAHSLADLAAECTACLKLFRALLGP